jgi:hypothetical protein
MIETAFYNAGLSTNGINPHGLIGVTVKQAKRRAENALAGVGV